MVLVAVSQKGYFRLGKGQKKATNMIEGVGAFFLCRKAVREFVFKKKKMKQKKQAYKIIHRMEKEDRHNCFSFSHKNLGALSDRQEQGFLGIVCNTEYWQVLDPFHLTLEKDSCLSGLACITNLVWQGERGNCGDWHSQTLVSF